MRRIISIRPKATDKRGEFIRGSNRTVQNKIINMIVQNPYNEYDFLIDDDGSKSIKSSGDLAGEVLNIIDDNYIVDFTEEEDGSILISISDKTNEGALPRQQTVDQLKRIRKISKKADIGDKISDMNKQGANIQYIKNPIDTGVESIENYWNNSKNFQPNWNLKHLKPYKSYPIPTEVVKKKKKKVKK